MYAFHALWKVLTVARRLVVLSVLIATKVFGQAGGGGTVEMVTLSETVPSGGAGM